MTNNGFCRVCIHSYSKNMCLNSSKSSGGGLLLLSTNCHTLICLYLCVPACHIYILIFGRVFSAVFLYVYHFYFRFKTKIWKENYKALVYTLRSPLYFSKLSAVSLAFSTSTDFTLLAKSCCRNALMVNFFNLPKINYCSVVFVFAFTIQGLTPSPSSPRLPWQALRLPTVWNKNQVACGSPPLQRH